MRISTFVAASFTSLALLAGTDTRNDSASAVVQPPSGSAQASALDIHGSPFPVHEHGVIIDDHGTGKRLRLIKDQTVYNEQILLPDMAIPNVMSSQDMDTRLVELSGLNVHVTTKEWRTSWVGADGGPRVMHWLPNSHLRVTWGTQAIDIEATGTGRALDSRLGDPAAFAWVREVQSSAASRSEIISALVAISNDSKVSRLDSTHGEDAIWTIYRVFGGALGLRRHYAELAANYPMPSAFNPAGGDPLVFVQFNCGVKVGRTTCTWKWQCSDGSTGYIDVGSGTTVGHELGCDNFTWTLLP